MPNWDDAWAQLLGHARWFYYLYTRAHATSTSLLAIEEQVKQIADGDYVSRWQDRLQQDRAALAAVLEPGNMRAAFGWHFLQLAKIVGAPDKDLGRILFVLGEHMHRHGLSVRRRPIDYGIPVQTAGPTAGKGRVYRLTVDRWGYPLQAVHLEPKRIRVVRDQGQVQRHAEVLQLVGQSAGVDRLAVTGSGIRSNLVSLHAAHEDLVLRNASFSSAAARFDAQGRSTDLTKLQAWEVTKGSLADLGLDRSRFYRGAPGDRTPQSLVFKQDATIRQVPADARRAKWDANVPYLRLLPTYRRAGATGTLFFRVGTQVLVQDLDQLADDAWTVLELPLDQSAYYDNFRENDLAIEIEATNLTGGPDAAVHVDDVTVAPMQALDGTWFAAVGGPVPFERGDVFTFEDRLTGPEGQLQHLLFLAGLSTLPSSGQPTIPDLAL